MSEKNCQSCQYHSGGVAVTLESGRTWNWQDCTKGWGKPTPIGVIKNLCGAYVPKKVAE